MTDNASPPPSEQRIAFSMPRLFPARSLGLKFLLVCLLALLMSIPAMFVGDIARERAASADGVRREIGALQGGRQTAIGPILVAPYTRTTQVTETVTQPDGAQRPVQRTQTERGAYAIFAETGRAEAALDTEVRARSVYRVPVYTADITLTAAFDIPRALDGIDPAIALDWRGARIVMFMSDLRGVRDVISLSIAGADPRPFEPAGDPVPGGASRPPENSGGGDGGTAGGLQAVAVRVGDLVGPQGVFEARTRMKLSGAEWFSLPAFAKDTTAEISGDWDDPAFVGAFPPEQRGTPSGGTDAASAGWTRTEPGRFTSEWRATYLARGLPKAGALGSDVSLAAVASRSFAVSLLDTGEIYVGVNRALKYALMFIGVVFLSYFMLEAVSGARAHPAQYLLVGLAQCVFYLLLLALAERTGFDAAFASAAGATVLLSAGYAAAVFRRPARGLQAGAVCALVYGLMYVLLTREDDALLVGAVTVFAVLALVMWLTRNINWYGGAATPDGSATQAAPR